VLRALGQVDELVVSASAGFAVGESIFTQWRHEK